MIYEFTKSRLLLRQWDRCVAKDTGLCHTGGARAKDTEELQWQCQSLYCLAVAPNSDIVIDTLALV